MSTSVLTRPLVLVETKAAPRTYDAGSGRSVAEVVLAPFGMPVWRVRLRPVAIRLVAEEKTAELTAHLSARPRFVSLPGTAGWFLPATPRSEILAFRATLPMVAAGDVVDADGVVEIGDRSWPVSLTVRCIAADDDHILIAVRGHVARTDDLPFPALRLGVDAALDLVRCG